MISLRYGLLALLFLSIVSCTKPDAYDSQGHAIRLKAYRGRWVLVNYWATWCVPCLRELPELSRFYSEYKKRVMVLGVNFDGLENHKLNFIARKLNIRFPLLSHFPINHLGIKNKVPMVPMTFIVSPTGQRVKGLFGPQTKDTLVSLLKLNSKHQVTNH